MKNLNEIVILIPALNPNEKLIDLIHDLQKEQLNNIIVINDGSNEECRHIFLSLKNSNVKVYEHEENMGKGQAIKTGIEKVINDDIKGIITMDADGQHLASDAKKIAQRLENDEVILGKRHFKGNYKVPLASKIGNAFSSLYFKLITGIYLEDTQTGLRGIPKKYLNFALEVSGSRYEYEMNFLKQMYYKKIKFDTVDIETIYEGRIKNFKPFKDSYIIYKEFIKNIISSITCAIVDILIFYILVSKNMSVVPANVLARITSGVLDFGLNKKWVFRIEKTTNTLCEASKYVILFIVQMLINSLLIYILNQYYAKWIVTIKIVINIIMYLVNFFIKKKFIFVQKEIKKR